VPIQEIDPQQRTRKNRFYFVCHFSGWYNFWNIIKIARCHILKLECTKFDFGWGSAPDPAWGANRVPQTPYVDLRGLLPAESRGGERKGKRRRKEPKKRGKKGRGRKGVRRG